MVAAIERPLGHMVLPNIRWETYERLLEEMGECHHRLTYDNGELEFMTLSLQHENFGEWIGHLILFVALELKVPLYCGGSTTLKQGLRKVGLEPDKCFWIKHEKQMRGKKKWHAATDPPPDLAVEIDITSSWLDRLGIYAALKVPEVWRYDGEKLKVLILGANGKFKEKAKSLAFPMLPLDGLASFIARLDGAEHVSLLQEFAAWLRAEVVAKGNGASTRKNGK
jgi:Uma2 family endonuclease